MDPLESREGVALDRIEGRLQRLAAVRVEVGIAWVVVPRVERTELLPCEVWDLLGIAAGDVLIRQTREQRPAEGPVHRGPRRCQRALHLVEHQALVAEPAPRARRTLDRKP